jgi:hypothetical protein
MSDTRSRLKREIPSPLAWVRLRIHQFIFEFGFWLFGQLLKFILRHLPTIGMIGFSNETILRRNGELAVAQCDFL